MSDEIELRIAELVGSGVCVASEDGEKVYEAIAEALRAGKRVQLSFAGVDDLTSAFLNTAVGQLYKGDFTDEFLRSHLAPPKDASAADLVLLKRVVLRAKEFFSNPERYDQLVKLALGDEDE